MAITATTAVTPVTTSTTPVTTVPATTVVQPNPVTKTVTQATVVQPQPLGTTLLQQLEHVDPLVWSVLASAIVLPLVHAAIKALAKRFYKELSSNAKTLLLIFLSGLVGILLNVQSSGVLEQLHNPLLAAFLTAAISFVTGHNIYQLFIKTNSELEATKDLPLNENPV